MLASLHLDTNLYELSKVLRAVLSFSSISYAKLVAEILSVSNKPCEFGYLFHIFMKIKWASWQHNSHFTDSVPVLVNGEADSHWMYDLLIPQSSSCFKFLQTHWIMYSTKLSLMHGRSAVSIPMYLGVNIYQHLCKHIDAVKFD